MGAASVAGTAVMARIHVRTGWKAILAWVAGISVLLFLTVASILDLFDTPEKIYSYADAAGEAMVMLNGRVAGLDTLGGIVVNEFSFTAAFVIPLLGIALVSRNTRKDESLGRLELLLSARVGRLAPTVAALLVATAVALLVGVGCFLAILPADLDPGRTALYCASLVALALVFAGITAVLAQVHEHNREVWMGGIGILILAFLFRGFGATKENWVIWLSPLGWVDQAQPFGEQRWWPILLMVGVALILMGAALYLNARRDVGSALLRSGSANPDAPSFLRTPLGLSLHVLRGPMIGWVLGAAVLMSMFGFLLETVLNAVETNPDLAEFFAGAGGLDPVIARVVPLAGFLAAAFGIQSVGSLAGEETGGRLEPQLAGTISRTRWLATNGAIIVVGALIITSIGVAALAASGAISLKDSSLIDEILIAGSAQLAAVMFFSALALVTYAWLPRLRAGVWALFGVSVVVTYMGGVLQLSDTQQKLSPFSFVGRSPLEDVSTTGVVTLLALTVALLALSMFGFQRRNIPIG